ncbi:hypothetical protein H9639_00800 [Arthrobacter sp. Sa2CUA1]|uniref:UsfY protein n=1 Tax=Arthrobacter gallicola TaxID=2762225 RepID=A0ABR8UMS0_9MICC|nr:hypothetical protein [Arthrobacter gallicola]MBD7993843.1 hypothetical protein [Arthrobacter gallicola]
MSEPGERAKGRHTTGMLAVTGTGSLVLLWTNNHFAEPWSWVLLGGGIILLAATIALLARLVLQQRDDYWQERGRDPRHPDAHRVGDEEM